ncbi:MAG: hypothetical protein Q7U86_02055 [Draconibacterium sp.]|nr:hypothetical protein [Draconibacterium sp.]
MIRKTNFFDQIEDYCLGQLEEVFKLEFETELKINPLLRSELELWMEIQSAIEEKEILSLRDKLENVTKQNKPVMSGNESFELLNEFSEIEEISEILSTEELINFYNSLPKVHVYHHVATSNENNHQFYKKQNVSDINGIQNIGDDLSDFDFEEFEGLEQAILEKDILHFRQTLKQVAKSVEPQFSVEEIDNYINGELNEIDLLGFEKDLFQNRSLRDEMKLHKDIDTAIQEIEIMNLRSQINSILQTETSWNVSEKSIEDYIDGVLEGELLDEFNYELKDNTDLMAEVELRRHVNESINEKDIFDLRNELRAAREASEVKKVKMIIPESKEGQMVFWRRSVAILIVLLGLAGVIGKSLVSVNNTDNYYESPSWSPERSLSNEITLHQKANISYMNEDWAQAVKILDELLKANSNSPVFDFYKAASLQKLDKFDEAIAGYTKVISHGDNMYIEESEWFRSLCYMKLGNQKKANAELLAVINRKGHFENEAKAVLRRLKYSVK